MANLAISTLHPMTPMNITVLNMLTPKDIAGIVDISGVELNHSIFPPPIYAQIVKMQWTLTWA